MGIFDDNMTTKSNTSNIKSTNSGGGGGIFSNSPTFSQERPVIQPKKNELSTYQKFDQHMGGFLPWGTKPIDLSEISGSDILNFGKNVGKDLINLPGIINNAGRQAMTFGQYNKITDWLDEKLGMEGLSKEYREKQESKSFLGDLGKGFGYLGGSLVPIEGIGKGVGWGLTKLGQKPATTFAGKVGQTIKKDAIAGGIYGGIDAGLNDENILKGVLTDAALFGGLGGVLKGAAEWKSLKNANNSPPRPLTLEDSFNEKISWKGKSEEPKTFKEKIDEKLTGFVDRFRPAQNMDKDYINERIKYENEQFEKGNKTRVDADERIEYYKSFLGKDGLLDADKSFYKQLRLFSGTPEKVNNIIETNLKPIIQDVEKTGYTVEEFAQYSLAKHVKDVNKTFGKDKKLINSGFSDAEADAIILKYQSPEMELAHQKLVKYNQDLLEYLADSELITRDTLEYLKTKFPNYTPLFRDMLDGELNGIDNLAQNINNNAIANIGKTIFSLKGSSKKVINPIENIYKNTFKIITNAEKNKVMKNLNSYLGELGDTLKVKKVPIGEESKYPNTVFYHEIGEKLKSDPNFVPKYIDNPAHVPSKIPDPANPGKMIPNPAYEKKWVKNPAYEPKEIKDPANPGKMIPNPKHIPKWTVNPKYQPSKIPDPANPGNYIKNPLYQKKKIKDPANKGQYIDNPAYEKKLIPNPAYIKMMMENPKYVPRMIPDPIDPARMVHNPAYEKKYFLDPTHKRGMVYDLDANGDPIYTSNKNYLSVSDDLYKMLKDLDAEQSNTLMKGLAKFASALRAGATLNPAFIIRNPFRDHFSAYVYSKSGYKFWTDWFRGLSEVIGKDKQEVKIGDYIPDFLTFYVPKSLKEKMYNSSINKTLYQAKGYYNEFLKNNGGYGSIISYDRDFQAQAIRELSSGNNFDARIKDLANSEGKWDWLKFPFRELDINVLQKLRNYSEITELSTKLGEYGAARRIGVSKMEAAYRARDVMDFARAGYITKELNKIISFINAGVQGASRAYRTFSEDGRFIYNEVKNANGRVNKIRTAGKELYGSSYGRATKALTSMTVAVFLAQKVIANDTQKKIINDAPDWLKSTFWLVPMPHIPGGKDNNTIVRIPKPFDISIPFANLPERFLNKYFNDNPKAFEGFASDSILQLIPPMMISGLTPIIEGMTNFSFFRKGDIIPAREQNLMSKDQYDINTSETAKEIAGVINPLVKNIPLLKNFGSPRIIDNTIQGYTAGLGKLGTQIIDKTLETTGAIDAKNKPDKKFSELPVVDAFTVNTASTGQSMQDLYSTKEKLTKEKNSAKLNKEPFKSNGKLNYINSQTALISNINKQIRTIRENKNLSPEVKRKRMDILNNRRNDISIRAMKRLNSWR